MAEFNLHVSVDAGELAADSLEASLQPSVDEHDGVTFAEDVESPNSGPDTLEATLEIESVDTYGELYAALRDSDDPLEVGLWGPTAERFALPVEHYALQQIPNPDAYEFHAIDHKVTLVIADSQQLIQQLRQEVPPAALG